MAHPLEKSPSPGPKGGMLALAARFLWHVFGTAALLFPAIFIAKTGKLSLYDLGYWAVAAALVAVRLVDVTLLDGQTAEGEKATPAHCRRYAVIVSIVSLALDPGLSSDPIRSEMRSCGADFPCRLPAMR